jgi:anti-sigma-K factor RskA
MSAMHDSVLDDVAVYALGTLPAAEAQRVRLHMASCEECRAEYAALTPTVAAVAGAAQASEASPLIKARIMREVRPSRASRANVWPAYFAAAACFALAVASVLYSVSLNDRLHATQASLAHQNAHVAQDEAMLADLASDSAQRFPVRGGEAVRAGGRLYLAMHDLPPAPNGKVYQAWTLPRGSKTMVPSVTFAPDKRGVALVAVSSDAGNDVAVAVSVEPPGGSKQPTSAPVLLAHL